MTGICGHIPGVTCSNCRPVTGYPWTMPQSSDLQRIAVALEKLVDVLTSDRYAANEERQREGQMEDAWQYRDWETVRHLQDEARQRAEASLSVTLSSDAIVRQSEPDPLDEDDHRDRLDRDGDIWVRNPGGCWHAAQRDCLGCKWTLARLSKRYGLLTFAPEEPPVPPAAPETKEGKETPRG